MIGDASRPAQATQLAATARRDPGEGERARQEARRDTVLARYGSVRTALLPCSGETALRDATWRHVVPGDARTGPSLMGWKDGDAAGLQPHVRGDVAAAIRMPATPAEAGRLEESAPADGYPDPDDQAAPVQSGQGARTREEAREAVRTLLVEGLTDREIARRIGVSPSTVGAVRKAAGLPSQGSPR